MFKGGINADYPNSDFAAQHTLNLALHHNLSLKDVEKIINLIQNFKKK